MPANQSSVMTYEVNSQVIMPYIEAMMHASGLTEFDATTSVLFAIATHIDLDQYPILLYLGPGGTGKSSAMKQLYPMCKGSKRIEGDTFSTQRHALIQVRTAFVDEADRIDSNNQLTDLYTRRYSKENGTIQVNVRGAYGAWMVESWDIFGATVMVKRASIRDVALRSRAIIVRTRYDVGSYRQTEIGDVSEIASTISDNVNQILSEYGEKDRVWQTWSPLYVIGQELGLNDWVSKSREAIEQETRALVGGQGYEPSEAVLHAIDILSREGGRRADNSIHISEVVRVVREEFALDLRGNQIEEEAQAIGFDVRTHHGFRVIKAKKDLLDALLPE